MATQSVPDPLFNALSTPPTILKSIRRFRDQIIPPNSTVEGVSSIQFQTSSAAECIYPKGARLRVTGRITTPTGTAVTVNEKYCLQPFGIFNSISYEIGGVQVESQSYTPYVATVRQLLTKSRPELDAHARKWGAEIESGSGVMNNIIPYQSYTTYVTTPNVVNNRNEHYNPALNRRVIDADIDGCGMISTSAQQFITYEYPLDMLFSWLGGQNADTIFFGQTHRIKFDINRGSGAVYHGMDVARTGIPAAAIFNITDANIIMPTLEFDTDSNVLIRQYIAENRQFTVLYEDVQSIITRNQAVGDKPSFTVTPSTTTPTKVVVTCIDGDGLTGYNMGKYTHRNVNSVALAINGDIVDSRISCDMLGGPGYNNKQLYDKYVSCCANPESPALSYEEFCYVYPMFCWNVDEMKWRAATAGTMSVALETNQNSTVPATLTAADMRNLTTTARRLAGGGAPYSIVAHFFSQKEVVFQYTESGVIVSRNN